MRQKRSSEKEAAALDQLIAEIIVDAYGDDEQLWAFREAFEQNVDLPCDGFVIGEPVSVTAFDYDGNPRRGLIATCRRDDGSNHVMAAADVAFPSQSIGGRHIAAYRRWLGLEALPPEVEPESGRRRGHKSAASHLNPTGPVELVALSVKERAARCRLLGSERVLTLRASRLWEVVPGEVLTVRPRRQWSYAGHPYLSGEVESSRLDVAALGLVPLRMENRGIWNPADEYWGEADEPVEEWAKSIIAGGRRPAFEMEQILPSSDPDDPDSDPICVSNDLKEAGAISEARALLMKLCEADLRCLDAHAHLGNLVFDDSPKQAIRHYEAGVRIGELSLGPTFDGLLPWGLMDNRPFIRCMHGFGLCLWRLGRFDEAGSVFDRMLWSNPSDNQGVRFLIDEVRRHTRWEDRASERQRPSL